MIKVAAGEADRSCSSEGHQRCPTIETQVGGQRADVVEQALA